MRREFTTLGGDKDDASGEPSEARNVGASKTSSGSADVDWLLRPGAIPDPALIHYARQRRLAARNMQESGELEVAAAPEDMDHAALGLAPEVEGEPWSERAFENVVKSKKAGESRLVRCLPILYSYLDCKGYSHHFSQRWIFINFEFIVSNTFINRDLQFMPFQIDMRINIQFKLSKYK